MAVGGREITEHQEASGEGGRAGRGQQQGQVGKEEMVVLQVAKMSLTVNKSDFGS